MLPDATIPGSLAGLLMAFRSCFTAPTFTTFSAMVMGLIAQTRRHTVCGMLLGVGLERLWHHARAHRLVATARWCADAVGLLLVDLRFHPRTGHRGFMPRGRWVDGSRREPRTGCDAGVSNVDVCGGSR
jgi:hypothetical protein